MSFSIKVYLKLILLAGRKQSTSIGDMDRSWLLETFGEWTVHSMYRMDWQERILMGHLLKDLEERLLTNVMATRIKGIKII